MQTAGPSTPSAQRPRGAAPLQPALDAFRMGRPVIVVDDVRPHRGAIVAVASERIGDDAVTFLALHARGIVALALLPNHLERLGLPLQNEDGLEHGLDRERYAVSVEAREGVSTGISAADRALTLRVASDYHSRDADLVTPGHVFPARAEVGGVLVRPGWAEAAVDVARLAGLRPVAAFCEVLDGAGEIATGEALEDYAATHGLATVKLTALIQHRSTMESFVSLLTQSTLPTHEGEFLCRVFRDDRTGKQHLALSRGELRGATEPVLCRVHSECLTGDVLGSQRCDCGPQLRRALERIVEEGTGVVVYLRQEGRGIGLDNKIRAYALQDEGRDTVEANVELGFDADARDYSVAAQILGALGVRELRLMTNNPAKIEGLESFGVQVTAREAHVVGPRTHDMTYLQTKRDKMGHMLADEDLRR